MKGTYKYIIFIDLDGTLLSYDIGFYEQMGFKTYKRTEQDEEGKTYPLLYMELSSTDN